ncbi:pseudaminic acid biosynthesis-associated methylase [Microbacterium sp. HJ5]
MREFTEQEEFWRGRFGDEYVVRNDGPELLASNLALFSDALRHAHSVRSLLEFGTNRGLNLRALHELLPHCRLSGVELNETAHAAAESLGIADVWMGSIFDYDVESTVDLTLAKGVLIHLDPELLPAAYAKLYEASERYILIVEYYNPEPVHVSYRGHENKLFKRDFAGEMLDLYDDLQLVDYGFRYRRDPGFLGTDCTWFLLEKPRRI